MTHTVQICQNVSGQPSESNNEMSLYGDFSSTYSLEDRSYSYYYNDYDDYDPCRDNDAERSACTIPENTHPVSQAVGKKKSRRPSPPSAPKEISRKPPDISGDAPDDAPLLTESGFARQEALFLMYNRLCAALRDKALPIPHFRNAINRPSPVLP